MKKLITICGIFLGILVIFSLKSVYGASVGASGPGSVTVGDTFTINITVSGGNFGTVGGKLSYDSSKVQFVSASGTCTSSRFIFLDKCIWAV